MGVGKEGGQTIIGCIGKVSISISELLELLLRLRFSSSEELDSDSDSLLVSPPTNPCDIELRRMWKLLFLHAFKIPW
jgi:hypothetical protein